MRAAFNKQYHTKPPKKVPIIFIVRDICLTLTIWALALWVSWDFLYNLFTGIVYEFDSDQFNDKDWEIFFTQLGVSFTFSFSVLIFIFCWLLFNIYLRYKTRARLGLETSPLSLNNEVTAYGCSPDDVKKWREEKVLIVSVDDEGQILRVDKPQSG